MKTLIALFALTLSVNAWAGQKTIYSCISDSGLLVTYNSSYGEIAVMDQAGNLLVDYDDGYDQMLGQLESMPPQPFLTVWHHEETGRTVLSLRAPNPWSPWTGIYVDNEDKVHNLNCL